MPNKLMMLLIAAVQLWAAGTTVAFAREPVYTEGKVPNGGSLHGKVSFSGPPPPPVAIDLKDNKNPTFCMENAKPNDKGELLLQHVEVRKGGLKDAVILIENINQGKAWPKTPLIVDFKNCQAFPKVAVIRKPRKFETTGLVTIRNHDQGVLHNPMGYSIGTTTRKIFFKKWLLNKGTNTDVTKTLKRLSQDRDSHFYIECEQHLWMTVSARVAWNPYYTISNEHGTFEIEQIPAGTYKVMIWHPYVGEKTVELKVTAGKETELNLNLP